MTHRITPLALCVALLCTSTGVAFAVNPPGTGQPSQSCQQQVAEPGKAANAGGSAFNENPGGVAGSVYANGPGTGGPGTTTGTGHITNPTAVAQYDVACFQVSNQVP
jgi:hypothetical protein